MCNSCSSVYDVDDQVSLRIVIAGKDRNLTFDSELQGVLDQVDQNLFESSLITD